MRISYLVTIEYHETDRNRHIGNVGCHFERVSGSASIQKQYTIHKRQKGDEKDPMASSGQG